MLNSVDENPKRGTFRWRDPGAEIREDEVAADEVRVTIPGKLLGRYFGITNADDAKVDSQPVRMRLIPTAQADAIAANRLPELVDQAGWSSEDLAAAAMLPQPLVIEYMNAPDASTIPYEHQKQLASGLEMPVGLVFPTDSSPEAVRQDRELGRFDVSVPEPNRGPQDEWRREAAERRQAALENEVSSLRRDLEIAGVRHDVTRLQREQRQREQTEQRSMADIRAEMNRRRH